jgi:hypothetical protein
MARPRSWAILDRDSAHARSPEARVRDFEDDIRKIQSRLDGWPPGSPCADAFGAGITSMVARAGTRPWSDRCLGKVDGQ